FFTVVHVNSIVTRFRYPSMNRTISNGFDRVLTQKAEPACNNSWFIHDAAWSPLQQDVQAKDQ
ncbi:hypothetical protein, partial [Corynebacterium yonathiae]